ncbi:MAG: molybdate ABC transporter substrate-binding protein [Nitriliruptoraceae bacterium]|nr:molybdate ABC transporter substrate-binding protein [Nitriliruptoraceae bacterium]
MNGVPGPVGALDRRSSRGRRSDDPGTGRRARGWRAGLAVALLVASCGPADAGGDPGDPDAVAGELIVFAAASLTDAFDELRAAFVDANPDIEVAFNYAGSQTLASQIAEGAPADVFAAANATQMDAVSGAGGLAGDPATFTANLLTIAVEPGNPLGIGGLTDLADPELVLVLPAEEVPAGQYASEALAAAGVEVTPSSLERDVRAALSKVELGEADASVVYASDIVASDGRADGVEIPVEQNVPATYPIAVLADAPNPTAAEAFVAFVLSDSGQRILASYGFTTP